MCAKNSYWIDCPVTGTYRCPTIERKGRDSMGHSITVRQSDVVFKPVAGRAVFVHKCKTCNVEHEARVIKALFHSQAQIDWSIKLGHKPRGCDAKCLNGKRSCDCKCMGKCHGRGACQC